MKEHKSLSLSSCKCVRVTFIALPFFVLTIAVGRVSKGGIFRKNSSILTVPEHGDPGAPSNSAEDGRGHVFSHPGRYQCSLKKSKSVIKTSYWVVIICSFNSMID